MRVVAGTVRGRLLQAPPGRGTRPTGDRVREAVFNALGSLGVVEGADVVDLFAGSGALGIEALSRRAARAVFVERERSALATIRANLERLGLAGPAAVIRAGDAVAAAADPELVAGAAVVFADPPYRFGGWAELLGGLAGAGFTGLLVAESGRPLAVPGDWHVVREKAYGSTVVTMVRPACTRLQEGQVQEEAER